MEKVDVLVIGGGLAGLSTAYHLRRLAPKLRCLVVEKRGIVGGLSSSVEQDGFVFDHTGHLLHLHDEYGKKLILGFLGGNARSVQRNSWIYSCRTFTRYPFQANTCGLPPKVIEDCVVGFMKTVHRPQPIEPGLSFRGWCLRMFGEGIARHFMTPYNEKLWNTPLERLTTEWQGRFVPKPRPEEVLYGALFDQKRFFGYNATFRYPALGGIQPLADAFAARVPPVRLGCELKRVDLAERVAVVAGLGEVRFERLVNTMPLKHFLGLASPLPAAARAAARALRYVSVYNLNLGIGRGGISDKHWIYFPEKRFVFYRAGFNSNFSPRVAPPKTTSMYIEVARRPEERVDLGRLERQIFDGLRSCGILRGSDKILARLWLPIPCAYALYDFKRTPAVRLAMAHLASRRVDSIGRYGAWKYSFMEEAILDGKRCAERLAGGASRAPGRAKRGSSGGPDRELVALK